MEKQFRAVQFGCGPIGCSVARLALERSNIELVGAVDIAADKAPQHDFPDQLRPFCQSPAPFFGQLHIIIDPSEDR